MTSSRGPLPKRSTERSRGEKPVVTGDLSVTKGEALPVKWPAANREWDPMAKDWFNSLKKSGINAYYQQSDIATAYILANEISNYMSTSPLRRSSQMFAALLAGMTSLGATEGDRRRMRIELESPRPDTQSATVTGIDMYKSRLGLVKAASE